MKSRWLNVTRWLNEISAESPVITTDIYTGVVNYSTSLSEHLGAINNGKELFGLLAYNISDVFVNGIVEIYLWHLYFVLCSMVIFDVLTQKHAAKLSQQLRLSGTVYLKTFTILYLRRHLPVYHTQQIINYSLSPHLSFTPN